MQQQHHHSQTELTAIDVEIARLIAERNRMIERGLFEEHLGEMSKRGQMVADILYKASTFQEPSVTLIYAKAYLLPWRCYVLDSHFPNLLRALPRDLPPSWTRVEAARFLLSVSRALEEDRVGMGK